MRCYILYRKALCCLSLLVFLPVIATEKWCNSPDDFKWLTEQIQIKINNLNDNLLPSMIKYNTFTNVKTAVLTDRCFIIVTAEQLNNSLQLLMSHFKTNSSNYNLTQQVVTFLNILHTHCSDETLSKPTDAAGKASLHEDKQHTNTHLFQYLFIGTAVALVLTLSALVHSHFKIKRLKQRLWNKDLEDHDTETSTSFLTTEI
ncbi:hypothetical protein chiPu_0012812 [Chiloscyllium punctatum]|uniref:Uncharacterized protein n=1 Tax=Chiloscyllium punctatum TaxID=137246 RepID=A0A401SVB1_CHIPU|nr:hypothetical protein [Chiloscyllium punctatum]